MMKDFLVFTCDKAWQETYIFKSLEKKGRARLRALFVAPPLAPFRQAA